MTVMTVRTEEIKKHLIKQFNLSSEQLEIMLPSFISTLAGHMTKLQAAMQENDPFMVGKAGHTLKGALLTLGLHDCADIAKKIEQNGKSGNLEFDYEAHFKNLQATMGKLA